MVHMHICLVISCVYDLFTYSDSRLSFSAFIRPRQSVKESYGLAMSSAKLSTFDCLDGKVVIYFAHVIISLLG